MSLKSLRSISRVKKEETKSSWAMKRGSPGKKKKDTVREDSREMWNPILEKRHS